MKGYILYSRSSKELAREVYEVNRLVETAEKQGIEIEVVRPEQFDLLVTREDRKSIRFEGESIPLPDLIIPRMGAKTTYFALAVIRHFERLGVFALNSSESIETVKDKLYTHQILAQNNLPVPKTMLCKFPVDEDLVEAHLGFPVVVKSITGTQGSSVFLAQDKNNFADLMGFIESTKSSANIILQEYIEHTRGRDLRVFTIGGRAVACMERTAPEGSFKANFSAGASVKSYEITPEIEWLATQASQILNLDIAGVDLLFAGDHFKVCEVNSSPGFRGIESCCDIDIASEMYRYSRIRLGLFD